MSIDVIVCPSAVRDGFHAGHTGTAVTQPAPIPTGDDPFHWHHYRVRAGENNCYFVFSNVWAPEHGYPGLSGIFGPDSFAFPRHEAILQDEKLAVSEIDISNASSTYAANVVRRKDLVLMRLPHHYEALIEPVKASAD